ncbi:MAG: response regulator [Candidatus Omnitrophica bacterium]|nr:response regulator [Candidatus Omnitrophota bacterium]
MSHHCIQSKIDLTGVETCRRLKAIDGCSPKVIVMTGQVDSVDAAKAKDAGADYYVVKTSNCKELLSAVQKILIP